MTRRRRPALSPTLFPFLAVLVCTLGTLILLLALVAQDAKESAKEVVDSEADTARELAEQKTWEAEQLIAYRDSQTSELEKRRGELAHLEDHVRRLREELGNLKTELEAADEDSDAEKRLAMQQRVAELDAQIAAEQDAITDLADQSTGRPPRIVIVPYKGTNGTQRRPVYVECTDQAIILQPEGVRITADMLSGPLGPGNALDSALRAIRSHWQKVDVDAPPPYPLLLVRPNGIHAYAACRMAMEAWDDQFGYELIPAELELAFPNPDPELREMITAAIEDSVARTASRIASTPRRYNQFAPTASRGSGGLSSVGDTEGMAAGLQTASEDASGEATDNAGSITASGSGSTAASSVDQAHGTATGSAFAGEANDGSTLGMASGGGEGQASLLAAGSRRPEPFDPAAEEIAELNGAGPTMSFDGGGGSGIEVGLTGPAIASTRADGADQQGGAGTGDAANQTGETVGNSPLAQAGTSAASGSVNGTTAGGGGASASNTGSPSTSGAGAMSNANTSSNQTFSEALQERARMEQAASATRPPTDELPTLSGGNNWALPNSMAQLRGPTVVRELQLECTADRLVLKGERGAADHEVVIRNGLLEQAVRELAGHIRTRVESWGPAMRNGRWEPVLNTRVLPGGENRYRQLEMLMRNSGVRLERSQTR